MTLRKVAVVPMAAALHQFFQRPGPDPPRIQLQILDVCLRYSISTMYVIGRENETPANPVFNSCSLAHSVSSSP